MTRWKKGERVAERLVIDGWLAAGGMAEIYVAQLSLPRGLVRRVAVKRINPHFASDEHFLSMFLDEARLASRLSHPGLVPVHDIIEHGNELLLILDYVPGWDLSAIVKKRRRDGCVLAPIAAAISIMLGVARTLAYVHTARDDRTDDDLGVVHRDVNPSNILLAEDGTTRLLDFGVAKAVARVSTTRTRSIKGKLAYLSPEQAASEDVDARTDLYGLGLVAFEVLAGRRYLRGKTEIKLIEEARSPTPRALRTFRNDVPADLEALVLALLARSPDDRPKNAGAVVQLIEQLSVAGSETSAAEWMAAVMGTRAREVDTDGASLEIALAKVARLHEQAGAGTAQLAKNGGWGAPPPVDDDVASTVALPTPTPALPTVPTPPPMVDTPARPRRVGIVAGAMAVVVSIAVAWGFTRPTTEVERLGRGFVRISTTPPGASVRVAGRDHPELTPTVVSASGGKVQRVELVLDDYVATSTSVVVRDGETTEVRAELRRLPGQLTIDTDPTGASVVIDGVERGTTPLVVDRLPRAKTSVSLSLDGHRVVTKEIDLDASAEATIRETLERVVAFGTLNVSSRPWASVRIGRRVVAESTPVTGIRLPVGVHKVKLESKRLGRTEVRTVRIRRGRTTSLIVEF